jgi:serine/threonine protein kinase
MDINKFKIIKELGHGMIGTVYLAKYKKKKYALKIEHILEEDIKESSSSSVWREIFFSNKFANKYPEQFIKLYKYDIIDNCTHEQTYNINVNLLNKSISKRIRNIAKSNYCIRKVYSLIDGNLKDILDKLTTKQLYSIILQYSYIILLLHNNGYAHCDIHSGNVAYVKTNKKFIEILDNKIPTYGYIVKLIDYGFIMNKNNNLSNENRKIYELQFLNEYNLNFIFDIIYDNTEFYDYLLKNKISYNNNEVYENFLKSDEYKIVKYLAEYDINRFYIYQILFVENFQKSILKNKFKNIIQPKIRGDLFDLLYFIKSYGNINNIINYYKRKLNIDDL